MIKRMISLWKMQIRGGSGVATKGGRGYDMPLMNPKAYIDLPITM